jgi:hypothetical protein
LLHAGWTEFQFKWTPQRPELGFLALGLSKVSHGHGHGGMPSTKLGDSKTRGGARKQKKTASVKKTTSVKKKLGCSSRCYIHLDIDDFRASEMSTHGDGVFFLTRMLPALPKISFFFSKDNGLKPEGLQVFNIILLPSPLVSIIMPRSIFTLCSNYLVSSLYISHIASLYISL